MTTSQSEFAGHGKFKWVKMDFKKEVFIITGASSMAKDYKNYFGQQKNPIDHFLRGIVNSIIETIIPKRFLTIETSCVAMNKRNCILVTKPFGEWNTKDSLIATQIPNKLYLMKDIGSKKEPFERII